MAPTLRDVFDPRSNSLNAVRLAMAVGVIVWHSYPLTGHELTYQPLRQAVAELWEDGFFAISGFLITSSWLRNPNIRNFVVARALRLIPAFYICLVLTAFVVAPVGVAMQGGNWAALITSADPVKYVLSNSGLWIFERGVGPTPTNVPHPGTWNGSLWTLAWEALCYIGILALGVFGLLKKRWSIPTAFAVTLIFLIYTHLAHTGGHPASAARFAIMFLSGALIYKYQDAIPCNRMTTLGALTVVAVCMHLSDYRIIAAAFWAYAAISIGAQVKTKHLQLKNDISYGFYIYGFPIQQLLFIAIGPIQPILFAVASISLTFPLAVASWLAVEKPSMKLRTRLGASPSNRAIIQNEETHDEKLLQLRDHGSQDGGTSHQPESTDNI